MPIGVYTGVDGTRNYNNGKRSNETTSLMVGDVNGEEIDDVEHNNRNTNTIRRYLERSDHDEVESDDDTDGTNLNLLRESLNKMKDSDTEDDGLLSTWTITCILSTSFAYGCITTTLFLITLPIECERIEKNTNIPKSVALGCFVAIAGITQLITPLAGMLSDTYRPPAQFQLGQRMPFLSLGAIFSVFGLFGEYINSYHKLWVPYAVFFFFHMIGLNITYSMMIALIPDQVPPSQTGKANGILAFLMVTGSLTGFGLFHLYFDGRIQDMYGLYICIVILTTILTGLYAHDRDVRLFVERLENSEIRQSTVRENHDLNSTPKSQRRRRRRRILLGPFSLLKTMIYDPIKIMDRNTLLATYTIDIQEHHDFFFVTVSRLFYYCGSSVQTFFLYFLHDIIRVRDDPESALAAMAIVTQISGALFCYPVGQFSDQFCDGRRKPFVYISCILLGGITSSMIFARTMDQMALLCFLLGAANGSYLTMETSLAIDALPKDYDDGPSGGNAQLLGIWGVAAFLGSALGPMIGGPLLYLYGSSGVDNGQDYTIEGYTVLLSLSAVYYLLSAISLRWVKKSNA